MVPKLHAFKSAFERHEAVKKKKKKKYRSSLFENSKPNLEMHQGDIIIRTVVVFCWKPLL